MENANHSKEVIPYVPEKPKSKFKLILAWILLGISIFYGISPVDLIPDYPLIGIGWLDDLGFFSLALYNLIKRWRESRA